MKLKRIFAALAAAAMLCGVSACSTADAPEDVPAETEYDINNAQYVNPGVLRGMDNLSIRTGASRSQEDTDKIYKVGVAKMMDHPALNQSEAGFTAALTDSGFVIGENIIIEYRDGQGEESNLNDIAAEFVSGNYDLIFAIATPAAQACAKKTSNIPIIATAVTDFVDAGLIESNARPATNVSGTTDISPIAEQIDLILKIFPDIKTVGFVYTASESNSVYQIGVARNAAESKGLKTVEMTINSENDISGTFTSIISQCDAIYLPTDNLLAKHMSAVAEVCNPAKMPVFCAEGGMVESGGFGTLALNYYDLGYSAGIMAIKVLDGGSIDRMSIQKSTSFEYSFNGATVEALGVTLPEEYLAYVS